MRQIAVLVLLFLAAPAQAAPERVVSMNLCTDQLALMLAAPGQLVSVSDWARRPRASNLPERAAELPANAATAEDVFMLGPDLVLAGAFTNRVAVDMLRRLGVRVEEFSPVTSLEGIPAVLRRLGRMLGREEAAEAAIARFEAGLARARARAAVLTERDGAYHYPNNYTSGAGTLADEVMRAARLENAAARLGKRGTTRIALETLVMLDPFLVRARHITGAERGRAFETARHPALASLSAEAGSATVEERWQVCGTPFVLRAIEALVAARRRQEGVVEQADAAP